jgi:hypothetical protein
MKTDLGFIGVDFYNYVCHILQGKTKRQFVNQKVIPLDCDKTKPHGFCCLTVWVHKDTYYKI